MSQDERPPPPKGIRLNLIEDCRRIVREYVACAGELDSVKAGDLARSLVDGGPLKQARLAAVYSSILAHVGEGWDGRSPQFLAYQLSGRYQELERGAIAPFTEPSLDGWVGVVVEGMEPAEWRDGRAASIMHLRCFYGHIAGVTLQRKVPDSYLRGMAYSLGFSRKLVYQDQPEDYTGLMMWAYITVDEEGYAIKAYEMNSRMYKENREIVKMRLRQLVDMPDDPCPIAHPFSCRDCDNLDCAANYRRYRLW